MLGSQIGTNKAMSPPPSEVFPVNIENQLCNNSEMKDEAGEDIQTASKTQSTTGRSNGALVNVNDDENQLVRSGPSDSRISYNSGYGDFCFGRLIDWRKEKVYANAFEGEHERVAGRLGSNGVPVPEIGCFKRSGPFKFFKLPLDIRKKIYQLLLAPFYSYNKLSKRSYIYFDLDYHCGSEDLVISELPSVSSVDEEYIMSEAEEEPMTHDHYEVLETARMKNQEVNQHKYARHPGRSFSYKIFTSATRNDTGSMFYLKDWLFIEWIRQASNVSPLFRKELGDVFWSNISIGTHNTSSRAIDLLPQLLVERPLIHSGIKSLTIFFEVERPEYPSQFDFEEWCNCISQKLKLEAMKIRLTIDKENLEVASQAKEPFSFLSAARKLQVTELFEVRLYIFKTEINYDDDEYELYESQLEDKYGPQFREIMLPDTMRVAQTEMDAYLASRSVPLSSAPSLTTAHRSVMQNRVD